MKRARLFLFVILWLSPTFTSAQPSSEDHPVIPSYLKDLEELGYCVIPQVFSTQETEQLYKRVWHEYIEKAWPNCRMDDRSNWKETFPIHNKSGIFSGIAGQTQVMWDLRQDSRIVDVFAPKLYSAKNRSHPIGRVVAGPIAGLLTSPRFLLTAVARYIALLKKII